MIDSNNFSNSIKLNNSDKVFHFKKANIEDKSFLLECFDNNHKINDIQKDDIDFIEEDTYIVKHNNTNLGFIKIYYKPSLDAYGFVSFLHPKTSSKIFKDFTIYSCYNLAKGISFLNLEKNNFYLDVPSKIIAKWVKQVSKTLKTFEIYDNYIVCYTSFSDLHLKNIISNIE